MGQPCRINKIQVWRVRVIKYIAKMGTRLRHQKKKINATVWTYVADRSVDNVLSHQPLPEGFHLVFGWGLIVSI